MFWNILPQTIFIFICAGEFLINLFHMITIPLHVPAPVLQFSMAEVAVTYVVDEFGVKVLRIFKRRELLVLAVCSACFLFGIPHITRVS